MIYNEIKCARKYTFTCVAAPLKLNGTLGCAIYKTNILFIMLYITYKVIAGIAGFQHDFKSIAFVPPVTV